MNVELLINTSNCHFEIVWLNFLELSSVIVQFFFFPFIFIVFWSLDVWFLLLWPPLLDQYLGLYQVKMRDLVNFFILQNRKKRCDFLHLVFGCGSWVFVHLNLIWGWIWHFIQGIVAKFIQKSCGYYISLSVFILDWKLGFLGQRHLDYWSVTD